MELLNYMKILREPIIYTFWALGIFSIIIVAFTTFFDIKITRVKRNFYTGATKCKYENTYKR